MNRTEVFGHIAAQAARGDISLPASVNAALRLQLALDDPNSSIEQAITLVLGEPQLAARVVALANSAAYSRSGDAIVTGVRAAVMRVGYRALRTLANALVVRQFGGRVTDPALRAKAEQLWQHTAQVAALAQVLARRVTGGDPDTALFAGIVHEVGAFYLISRAEEFPGLLDGEPMDDEPVDDVCEEVVTREVLRKLSVPEPVSAAIVGARDGMLGMPPAGLLDTLVLANSLATVASPLGAATPLPDHADRALDFVIDEALLASLREEAARELAVLNAAMAG